MPRPATPIGQLTEREQDVARLMACGYTNPRIAEELGITFATAKWYVSQVIAKLGAMKRELDNNGLVAFGMHQLTLVPDRCYSNLA
jgi:DNA-binding NarL/FixJ family response regulator